MCEKAKLRLMLTVAISLCAAACAPTYAPHIDAPSITALDPPPRLPDADRSECPPGSGFVACFTPAQEAIRQQRFALLHDDRDYCRDAYARAVKNADQ